MNRILNISPTFGMKPGNQPLNTEEMVAVMMAVA